MRASRGDAEVRHGAASGEKSCIDDESALCARESLNDISAMARTTPTHPLAGPPTSPTAVSPPLPTPRVELEHGTDALKMVAVWTCLMAQLAIGCLAMGEEPTSFADTSSFEADAHLLSRRIDRPSVLLALRCRAERLAGGSSNGSCSSPTRTVRPTKACGWRSGTWSAR